MITKDNLKEVINSLSEKDKRRVLNSSKEYTLLNMHIFNTGYYVTVMFTNDYYRYKNVSNFGDVILYTQEVQDLINDL